MTVVISAFSSTDPVSKLVMFGGRLISSEVNLTLSIVKPKLLLAVGIVLGSMPSKTSSPNT